MTIIGHFQISIEACERSSTLSKRDAGTWALLVSGCYQLFNSFDAASECKKFLNS